MAEKKSAALPLIGIAAILAGFFWMGKANAKPKVSPPRPEPDPTPEPEPEPGPAPEPEPEPEPSTPMLPPIEQLERSTPTMSHFYQVRSGNRFGGTGRNGITYNALYQFARQVAEDRGDPNPDAYAERIAGSGINRTRYLDLILCSGWNDLVYGTYGYGSRAHAGPHGRSIRLHKVHANNRDLIAQGKPVVRNIEMLSPSERRAGKTAGAVERDLAEAFEFLWLPPIDADALYDRGEITTEGLSWGDGSSVMWPHPGVMALEIEVYNDPQQPVYGCEAGELVT